jgi:hypothetical protein
MGEDSWDSSTWEDLALRLLSETIKVINEEEFTISLAQALSQQIPVFKTTSSELSKAAYKHMGVILQKMNKKDVCQCVSTTTTTTTTTTGCASVCSSNTLALRSLWLDLLRPSKRSWTSCSKSPITLMTFNAKYVLVLVSQQDKSLRLLTMLLAIGLRSRLWLLFSIALGSGARQGQGRWCRLQASK